MRFFSLHSLLEAKKSRTAPVARGDMDRWLKSVDALARDLEEYKKVKKDTDKKISELKRKHKDAKDKAEKAAKERELAQAKTKAELASAKKDLDAKKQPEQGRAPTPKRKPTVKKQPSAEAKKLSMPQRPDKGQNFKRSGRIIDQKGQRRDGRQQTTRTRRTAGE